MMSPLLEDFPTELIAQIYLSCEAVNDACSLSATCTRLRKIYNAPGRKLQILEATAESQFGPVQDAINLITHNSSQAAHLVRNVPVSMALLKQVVHVGKTANKWADAIYPFKKWKDKYEDRRLLTEQERYALRRAVYRLWLYRRAFCNVDHPRTTRLIPLLLLQRAALLHNFHNEELAEMIDLQNIVRDTLATNICPSNGAVQRKFRKRFPDTNYQLLFNMHLNYPPSPTHLSPQEAQQYKYYAKYRPTAYHEPGCEGWGDDISHYYVIEDMLKLDFEQILWLKDNAPSKFHVESYVRSLGAWFDNNGDTFQETVETVLVQRGAEVGEFLEAVADGELGVVKSSL